jgi:hypothetical protein
MKNSIKKSEDIVPKVFEFNIGSCLDFNNFSVKIENGRIVPAHDHLLFPNFDNDYIIPTVDEWENFWKKMDKIGVWDWIESYSPQHSFFDDGTTWNLKIEVGTRKFECSGLNAYPGDEIGEIIDGD